MLSESTSERSLLIDLRSLFLTAQDHSSPPLIDGQAFTRTALADAGMASVVQDRFAESHAAVSFLRIAGKDASQASISLDGGYQLETCVAGGWIISPLDSSRDSYWIPQAPHLRKLDHDGHILAHQQAQATGCNVSPSRLAVTLDIPQDQVLDITAWRLPANEPELARSLQTLSTLERQRYFLWSSHTVYQRPADLYLHLVHGHVYENHEVWPKYWRVCSELDAYALYVAISGLLKTTGKRLYALLRAQLAFSVIARQAEDGGWYHGEWTDQMESHYRLHGGAMHLLAAYFEETRDAVVGTALEKAAAFAAARTDRLDSGAWYLHDSLEQNAKTLEKYPFRTTRSRALGKSESNLLVLNTHLDTNIAMERCRRVTGNGRHDALIDSANVSTRAVLELRPAEWLYRPLFRAIGLTFLPSEQASRLPLFKRALKRIAWKYLVAQLPRIKARFPRLVMPDGFIDRGLAQYGLSVRYQPVNLLDLIRTRRMFGDARLDEVLESGFSFTQQSGITRRWKEMKGKEDDALGFWAEALYHLCLANPAPIYRAWLAEAMIDLEDNALGLSPSLLGANAEAVGPEKQHPCPSPRDSRLRVANLSHGENIELLIANPTTEPITLEWEIPPQNTMSWQVLDSHESQPAASPKIAPRSSLRGMLTVGSTAPTRTLDSAYDYQGDQTFTRIAEVMPGPHAFRST